MLPCGCTGRQVIDLTTGEELELRGETCEVCLGLAAGTAPRNAQLDLLKPSTEPVNRLRS